MNKTNIIYILSTGHSGSTLLNKILGSTSNSFSVGEISNIKIFIKEKEIRPGNTRANSNYLCDCKEKLKDCKIWKNIIQDLDVKKTIPLDYTIASRLKILKNIVLNKPNRKKYSGTKQLYSNLHKYIINKKTNYVIDSSKNLLYFYHLNSLKNINLQVIHLTRDGRGVINSYQKRGRSSFKLYFNWLINNTLMRYYLKNNFSQKSYMTLSYNKFVQNPQKYIKQINKKFKLKINEKTFLDNVNRTQYHNFAGNPMRHKKIQSIKEDNSWEKQMPKWQQYLLTTICYIPNKLWVYNKKNNKPN